MHLTGDIKISHYPIAVTIRIHIFFFLTAAYYSDSQVNKKIHLQYKFTIINNINYINY